MRSATRYFRSNGTTNRSTDNTRRNATKGTRYIQRGVSRQLIGQYSSVQSRLTEYRHNHSKCQHPSRHISDKALASPCVYAPRIHRRIGVPFHTYPCIVRISGGGKISGDHPCALVVESTRKLQASNAGDDVAHFRFGRPQFWPSFAVLRIILSNKDRSLSRSMNSVAPLSSPQSQSCISRTQ